jgi:hypothetical protein
VIGDIPLKDQKLGKILSTKIQLVLHSYEELKKKLKQMQDEFDHLSKDNSSMVKRFLLEMERKKVEIELSKTGLREAVNSAERAKAERMQYQLEIEKVSKQTLYNEDHLRRLIRDRDEQIAEIIQKSNSQLKALREQYTSDKSRFSVEIDELKKSKIELQVEIGHLLRDKRRVEFELESRR